MRRLLFILVTATAFAWAAQAEARVIDEVRFGVAAHNVSFNNSSAQGDEKGPNLEVEIVGKPPRALRRLGSPRPYAMVSANLNGDTSYAAAGLEWRLRLNDQWSLQPAICVAVHDGAEHNRYQPSDPRAHDYARRHQLLGSRVLFRESVALERRLDDRHAVALVYEHLSNGGGLFGHDDNQSLNQVGVRLSVRLN